MKQLFRLDGKIAIVTGSSRGIGRAIADTMADLGAKVVISGRTLAKCEVAAAAIRARGGEATVIPCDIACKEECERLVTRSIEQFGRIDILVCNAAVSPAHGPIAKVSDDEFDQIMIANVKSTLWLTNMIIPGMAARGGGAVVIIGSVAGLRGNRLIGAYGMSKAADFALARNLALEWGPSNVRVNCIAPGLVKTDFARNFWENEAILAERLQRTPLRRIGLPEDFGPLAAFLASPASSFITGQVIAADGGVTIT